MSTKTLFIFLLSSELVASISANDNFVFNGFSGANLSIDGSGSITSDGLLELTKSTLNVMGHAFHPVPLHFMPQAHKILSFSMTFVFGIVPDIPGYISHGIAFVISRTMNFSTALASKYMGIFNGSNNGNPTNHIFAVELDTLLNPEFNDVDDNHVGIDINGLMSNKFHMAGYYEDSGGLFKNLTLVSGQPMQVWIYFHAEDMLLNVTLSPVGIPKPTRPLLSSVIDLSEVMLDPLYVGLSSSTGSFYTTHCILGWSFKLNGTAHALDYAKLPQLPSTKAKGSMNLAIWLPVACCSVVLVTRGTR